MKYRAIYSFPHKRSEDGPVRDTEAEAADDARKQKQAGAIYAAVLRDSEGDDHPDNAGKFFLHRYIQA